MKNRVMLKMVLLVIFFTGCTIDNGAGIDNDITAERFQTQFYGLFDTVTVIIGYAENEEKFTEYAEIIHARMGELHKLYDIYNEYEGINNLCTVNRNAGIAPVAVSEEIIDLLLIAQKGYEITDGTINPALGSVLKIWHDYRERGINSPEYAELPPMELLKEANAGTSIDNVIIDEANKTVFLKSPSTSLDVGALAKAYAEELAVREAKDAGLTSAIISAGGNITTVGKPSEANREHWNVGIQDPDMTVSGTQNTIDVTFFNDKTVAVSGGYERYYEVDGKPYHHIIDPGTLMPAALYKQVAVIHEEPVMADILSTALFILPYEESRKLAESQNAEVLWVDLDGNWLYTDGYAAISKELGSGGGN